MHEAMAWRGVDNDHRHNTHTDKRPNSRSLAAYFCGNACRIRSIAFCCWWCAGAYRQKRLKLPEKSRRRPEHKTVATLCSDDGPSGHECDSRTHCIRRKWTAVGLVFDVLRFHGVVSS